MIKEEWNLVERKLRETYTPVNLKIDNFKVTLVLERTGVYKNAIIVYVNGKIKGEWFLNDCEERRRFYPRKKKSLLSSKAKQKLFKGLTKKQKAELEAEWTIVNKVDTKKRNKAVLHAKPVDCDVCME